MPDLTARAGRRLSLGLGLLTAIGGLVDVGNLVANPQAGARYGVALVPVLAMAGVAVAVFSEMAGRVAAVTGRAGFEVVTDRLPPRLSELNLLACLALTVMTCTAEVGGVAQLAGTATATSARWWALPAAAVVAAVVWGASFHRAETFFGLAGLALVVVVAALLAARPHWGAAVGGRPWPGRTGIAPFLYTAIAQVGSMMVPYQLVFFSSGVREEGWTRRRLGDTRANAWVGYGFGTLVVVALTVLAAAVYPAGTEMRDLGQVARLPVRAGLGRAGGAVMTGGMFVAMVGAALETALAAGYMTAQHRGWRWSMDRPVRRSRAFFAVTLGTLAVAGAVMTGGVDVVALTDWSLVLSTLALPLTYGPVWVAARDRRAMGEHASGRATDAAGAAFLGLAVVVAAAAVPVLTLGG